MRALSLVCLCCSFLVAQEPHSSAPVVTLTSPAAMIEVGGPRAAIVRMLLPDVHPIRLPTWLGEQADNLREQPLAVLDAYNAINPQTGAGAEHNWLWNLQLAPEGWQLVEQSADRALFSALAQEGKVRYTLSYQLLANRPSVVCELRAEATGDQAVTISPVLVAVNGLHQDLGKADAYYQGVYTATADGKDLSSHGLPSMPKLAGQAPVQGATLHLADQRYVALRSRFFAAFWQPEVVAAPLEAGTQAPVDGPLAAAPIAAAANVPLATNIQPYGFIAQGTDAQHQVFFNVTWGTGDQRLEPGQTFAVGWRLTASCLNRDGLARLDAAEQEIEYTSGLYRFFRVLVKAFIGLLRVVYAGFDAIGLGSIGYGLAVIVATLIVKALLHRLNYKAQKSMLMMQKLAPELQKLKAQYGGNNQEMAKKQMELWKKHGVNPLGGCLPMLLQFPIFIALYASFGLAADLRGQSFLWIHDLTLPDYTFYLGFTVLGWQATLNVLPIFYIALSLYIGLSQKIPEGADKTQQDMAKMMRFLPVIFGVIFYAMPAGLVLYFCVQALVSFLETKWIRKQLGMG